MQTSGACYWTTCSGFLIVEGSPAHQFIAQLASSTAGPPAVADDSAVEQRPALRSRKRVLHRRWNNRRRRCFPYQAQTVRLPNPRRPWSRRSGFW